MIITNILLIIWLTAILIPIFLMEEWEIYYPWLIWFALSILWIVPIFTGIHVKNNEGQFKGYVTAIEQSGAIFVGWNAHLKTELESSNEETACINRTDKELIEGLKKAQVNKENIVLQYEGVWQYAIGECPSSSWMIIGVK